MNRKIKEKRGRVVLFTLIVLILSIALIQGCEENTKKYVKLKSAMFLEEDLIKYGKHTVMVTVENKNVFRDAKCNILADNNTMELGIIKKETQNTYNVSIDKNNESVSSSIKLECEWVKITQ